MKSPIKFRWIILVVVVIALFNAFGALNQKLNKADYYHCLSTSKMTEVECQVITNYNPSK